MYHYEYNITLEERDGLWYYVVAQEFDEKVEFLGWGFAETKETAAECIVGYIREQFGAPNIPE